MQTPTHEVRGPLTGSHQPDESPGPPMQGKHPAVLDLEPWVQEDTTSSEPENEPEGRAVAAPTPPKSSDSSENSEGNDAEVTSSGSSTSKGESEGCSSSTSPESDGDVPKSTGRPISLTPNLPTPTKKGEVQRTVSVHMRPVPSSSRRDKARQSSRIVKKGKVKQQQSYSRRSRRPGLESRPPQPEDERWRVSLARYAFLSLIAFLAVVFIVTAAIFAFRAPNVASAQNSENLTSFLNKQLTSGALTVSNTSADSFKAENRTETNIMSTGGATSDRDVGA